MSSSHYNRAIPCYICGCLVYTTAAKSMCPDCRRERDAECARKRYQYKVELDYYQVISDPDEIGGFRKGAGISTTELEIMLRVDSPGFTPGTIIKKKTGEIFKIILGKNGGLRLKMV